MFKFTIIFVKYAHWFIFFFFKQKTAYEMRISDWSSDVCSSDLRGVVQNEKREGDNNPYGLLRYEIFENLFPSGHPYHHSTIGSKIGRASCRERVCQYV